MAYQTGPYTDQNNALDLFRAWAVSAGGYTVNDFADDSSKYSGDTFTGKRLHIQKNIGGTDFYFNFRSCSNQKVFEYTYYDNVTGICCNSSTGYSVANTWDKQPGFTVYQRGQSEPSGGCVDSIIETGGTYFFFQSSNQLSAVFTTDSGGGDYRIITIDVVNGRPFFSCSGGSSNQYTAGIRDARSAYMGYIGASTSYTAAALLYNSEWYTLYPVKQATFGVGDLGTIVNVAGTGFSIQDGSEASAVMLYSPDPFRGNAQLAPFAPVIVKSLTGIMHKIGTIEGVYFLNMKNYQNEQEITIGADTYKLFKVYNFYDSGVAFLK